MCHKLPQITFYLLNVVWECGVCVEAGGQPWVLFLESSAPVLGDIASHGDLGLHLVEAGWLLSLQDRTCLAPPPQCWDHKDPPLCLAFWHGFWEPNPGLHAWTVLTEPLPQPPKIALTDRSPVSLCFPPHTLLLYPIFVFVLLPGSNNINRVIASMENGENEGTTKIIAPSPVKRSVCVQLCALYKFFPLTARSRISLW